MTPVSTWHPRFGFIVEPKQRGPPRFDPRSGTRSLAPVLIKVLNDYHCWPLWVRGEHDEFFEPRDPATLGLSAGIVGRLGAWQQWYESMVNIADPDDSRPVTVAEDEAFAAEGRLLAARVAEELPHAVVWFHRDPQPRS